MEDLELAVACASAGAEIVLAQFGTSPQADLKGTNNPVTEVDRASEAAIVTLIEAHRPEDAIIAEEGTGSGAPRARRWLIDPLDGTVNFVHGIPQVSVSVAVYEADEPLAAAIADPLCDEIFTAAAGAGTSLNGTPQTVSGAAGLSGTVVATGFAYDHDRYAAEYTPLAAVLAKVNGVRRFGSAALDLAWTACGRFDGYWELGVAPWDIAAGILMVREAGGIVTDPFGNPARPESSNVVAAGPLLHEPLRAVVATNLPDRLREAP